MSRQTLMTQYGTGTKRVKGDLYTEPVQASERLLDVEEFPYICWDPAAGRGNILKAFRGRGLSIRGTDISTGTDFLRTRRTVDCIITNPPYSIAEKFLDKSFGLAKLKVAFLLRLQFLEGIGRFNRIFKSRPPTRVWVFPDRIGMGGHKGGMVAHAWLVWELILPERMSSIHWLDPMGYR